MNWLQSILFGLIAGFSEFFPISASAHKLIAGHLMGIDANDPLLDFVCAFASLLALLSAHRNVLEHIRRDRRLLERRGRRAHITKTTRDMRIVTGATVPMLLLFVVLTYILQFQLSLPLTALMLLLNGIILFIPSRTLQGNKDARSISRLDSFLIGFLGGISVVTGISRTGIQVSYAKFRGANADHAVNWALLLSIPALIALCVISLLSVITGFSGIAFSGGFFSYLLVFISSFSSSYAGILIINFLAGKNSLHTFCYYCWGTALFTFIIYLV